MRPPSTLGRPSQRLVPGRFAGRIVARTQAWIGRHEGAHGAVPSSGPPSYLSSGSRHPVRETEKRAIPSRVRLERWDSDFSSHLALASLVGSRHRPGPVNAALAGPLHVGTEWAVGVHNESLRLSYIRTPLANRSERSTELGALAGHSPTCEGLVGIGLPSLSRPPFREPCWRCPDTNLQGFRHPRN
jgi:hypothetical protein